MHKNGGYFKLLLLLLLSCDRANEWASKQRDKIHNAHTTPHYTQRPASGTRR